jgi:transcriptional regulator with XRE-family HTH domain
MFLNNFSDRLKEERTKLNLNQSDFAELCGVKKLAQFHYEKGDRYPDANYLMQAHKVGVDVNYLLTGQKALERESNNNTEDDFILEKLKMATDDMKKQILLILLGAPIATNHVANPHGNKNKNINVSHNAGNISAEDINIKK